MAADATVVDGLDATVEIRRDGHGVAHVRATTSADAFFGQGWVAARDRAWQIETDRRKAVGRWAEVIGAAGVGSDRFFRRLDLASAARRDLATLDRDARVAVEAYAAGVDAAFATMADPPVEARLLDHSFETFQPWECLAIYKLRHVFMGTHARKLWRAALVARHGAGVLERLYGRQRTEPLILPPGGELDVAIDLAAQLRPGLDALDALVDEDGGSNNWAVAPSRTASGAPLLAGDPHRALDVPNVYHQNHVRAPGLDVIGLSFPGVPAFPHFGHNERLAWCITHGMADDQDLFVEQLDGPAHDPRVRTPDGWLTCSHRNETIAVRDGDDIDLEIVHTDHGPLLWGGVDGGVGISMRWTATAEPDTTLDAAVAMLTTKDVGELDAAMAPWVVPVNNLVAADVDGSIAYLLRGRLAERPVANRWVPVPGWTGEHEWTGWVPFAERPRLRDPERGWIATTNNRVADEPPYVSTDYAGPSRQRRIRRLLDETADATVDAMVAILADDVSSTAAGFAARIAALAPSEPRATEAVERVRAWDHRMAPDSVAASIYAVTRAELTAAIVAAERLDVTDLASFGRVVDGYGLARHLWSAGVTLLDDHVDGLADALDRALDRLTEAMGPDMDAWHWGDLHPAEPFHPLSVERPDLAEHLAMPSVPTGGDGDTLRSAWVLPAHTSGFAAPAGSVARYVFDLADWDASRWSVVHGVSGDRSSPHFLDQLASWSEVALVPMPFTTAAVDAATRSIEVLRPER
ncbi:MAG: penicillin acylase family protein [Actinomycetota bacterium]|nr:penicillin acylase family protein [Actinomycetota bacterium]